MTQKRVQTIILTEAALMTALAVLLGFIQFRGPWVAGGSISFEMLPLILFSLRRGVKWGFLVGVVYGVLDFIFQPFYVHPIQMLLDYPVAFGLLGLAGLFVVKRTQSKGMKLTWVILATTLSVFARFVSHFVSAIVFFGANAPEGQPVAIYSFLYNIGYVGPSYIIVLIILIIFVIVIPQLVARQSK